LEHFEKLKRFKKEQKHNQTTFQSFNSSFNFEENYQGVTWGIRRELLLEYEKKLEDYYNKLGIELAKVILNLYH
jgi:hypothetical protein